MEEKREGGRERVRGRGKEKNAFEFDKHIQQFDYFLHSYKLL